MRAPGVAFVGRLGVVSLEASGACEYTNIHSTCIFWWKVLV